MAFTLTGANMPTPSASAVATTANYVASNHIKPEVGEALIKRYGNQGLSGLLEFAGAKKATASGEYAHYEERFIHDAFTATIAAAGALTIDASAEAPLRVGDLLLSETGVTYIVASNASATGATVATADGSTLGAETSKKMAIVGNAHAEGGEQPKGLTPSVDKYINYTQIIKESYDVTGSAATDMAWFKTDAGYLWYLKGESDTALRFDNYAELQMLTGPGTNAVQTGNIKYTRGLINDINDNGNKYVGTTGETIAFADLDKIITELDKQRGAKENAFMCGLALSLDVDDMLAAQANGSAAVGASYGAFENSQDNAVNLGFAAFTRGGYTFHKKTYDVFNHPMLLGAVGYNNAGMIIPLDKQKDAKTAEMIPSLQIRYKAGGSYSRENEHWLTGGAVLADKTSGKDELNCNYRCEKGFEGFALNRFFFINS